MNRMTNEATIKTANGQVQLSFPNGFEISMINHCGSYTENRSYQLSYAEQIDRSWESKTVEIAVYQNDNMVRLTESDQVVGWVPVERIPTILIEVAKGDLQAIKNLVNQ
jgi:DUF4097 and DUF4098 domain-containing protein YvlB